MNVDISFPTFTLSCGLFGKDLQFSSNIWELKIHFYIIDFFNCFVIKGHGLYNIYSWKPTEAFCGLPCKTFRKCVHESDIKGRHGTGLQSSNSAG